MFKLILYLCLLMPCAAQAQLKVVTTTTDLAALAREVGGEFIEVTSLARGNQDPHYLEAKPSYARTLNQADLLIEVGLDLEVGWLPVLLTQARNPAILNRSKGRLDASNGLRLLEIPQGKVDRSQGDIHPGGNPHYWLDPRNALEIAKNIPTMLSILDPDNSLNYSNLYNKFKVSLNDKVSQWKPRLKALKPRKLITGHRTFSYFAAWSGVKIVDVIEAKPGIPPSPSHLVKLLKLIPAQQVDLIWSENYSDPKPAKELARRSKVSWKLVPTSVGGVKAATSYIELIDYLIQQLEPAS